MRPANQRCAASSPATSSRTFCPNRKRSLVSWSVTDQVAPLRGPRHAFIAASVFSWARIGTSSNTTLPWVWSRWQCVLMTRRSGWPVAASAASRSARPSRGYCWVSTISRPSGVSIAPALESPPAPIQACTPSATVTRRGSGVGLFIEPMPTLGSLQLAGADQLGELLLGERRGHELVLDRLGHDLVDADHLVGRHAVLRDELAHAADRALRHLGEIGVDPERGRVGIHPLHRLP